MNKNNRKIDFSLVSAHSAFFIEILPLMMGVGGAYPYLGQGQKIYWVLSKGGGMWVGGLRISKASS